MGERDAAAIAAARAVIDRWGLHDDLVLDLPVPIERVARREGWRILWGPLYPVLGYAVVARGVRLMRIDERLSSSWARVTIAHELAHVLIEPHAPLRLCLEQLMPRPDQETERAATLAGLLILVPERLLTAGLPAREIAARCGVPEDLVRWLAAALLGEKDD